ncbi:MAG: uncharacterized protein KVP18_000502 [Porospora cf. gigantea A]|uniref:uncharacterized protein n=1 Tax=Porospora cf. gigantea A TaxID=2853593 RepID=UPI00355A6A07|nr:MAG: hypothetical protein KVP18_000502 [Porospora cf. gigantea A]
MGGLHTVLVSLLARKVQTEKMKASVSRTNLAEMERIWSSSKDRTDEHFTEVQELCSTMTDFVAKYHHLREKGLRKSVDVSKIVKALEDECQELDDALATVAKALKAHRAQDRELDRTLKTTRNSACLQSITPDELVNMKLQLQQLENKNGSLATEQTRLQRYVDHLDTRVKELEIHEDKTSTASPRRSLAKLLKKRDKLFSTIASERAKYESRLAQAEKDAVKFGEYVEFLSFRVAAGQ